MGKDNLFELEEAALMVDFVEGYEKETLLNYMATIAEELEEDEQMFAHAIIIEAL